MGSLSQRNLLSQSKLCFVKAYVLFHFGAQFYVTMSNLSALCVSVDEWINLWYNIKYIDKANCMEASVLTVVFCQKTGWHKAVKHFNAVSEK